MKETSTPPKKNKWQKMTLIEFKRAIADPARDARHKNDLAKLFRSARMT